MQNMPDEEIDELFRKAAAQFEPDYDPRFWEPMQDKLDNALAEEFVRRKLFWLTLAEGLFIVLICLLFMIPTSNKAVLQTGISESISDTSSFVLKPNQTLPEKHKPDTSTKTKITSDTEKQKTKKNNTITTTDTQAKESAIADNIITNKPGIDGKKQETGIHKNTTKQADNHVLKENTDNLKTTRQPESRYIHNSVLTKPVIKDTLQSPIYYSDKESSLLKDNQSLKEQKVLSRQLTLITPLLSGLPVLKTDSLKKTDKLESAIYPDTSAEKSSTRKSYRLTSHLSVGLVVAPDLSSIGFRNLKAPGKNGGILVGYSFSPRWSVATGVIYAKKNYSALPEDYHSGWSWFQQVNVTDINVSCIVIDIPVNVQYKFLIRPRYSFYAVTGISSYFMEEEDYSYRYIQNNQSKTRDWTFNNENEHLLGVANFALGYEKRLSQRLSLQVESFFKQPLTDIGVAKVRLNSMGVFFIARYHFH